MALTRETYPKIYLCGPIQGRTDADCRDWREHVKQLWLGECLDPMRHDYRGREREPGIEKRIVSSDLLDISHCAGVLCFFDRASFGTAMELVYAKRRPNKVPIVVVNASGEPTSPWVRYHSDHVIESPKPPDHLHALRVALVELHSLIRF